MAKSYWIRGSKREAPPKPIKDGANIYDLVMEYNPVTGQWAAPTICLQNNQPVLRKEWSKTFVAHDDIITFVELPRGGGGSNPLQIIFSIAVMAVAWWAGPVIAGALGLGQTAATLISGSILMAGGLLAGAIFKQKAISGQTATSEQADPTYSVSGGNRARLYEVIGEEFGRMRIVPDQVARPWAYYIGNDQYYYQVLGIGRGLYEVESMSFGDTKFWTKNDGLVSGYEVELEFQEPGQPVSLFPDNVDTSIEVAGQEIFNPNHPEYKGWLGPYSANSPGTKTNRIVSNIVFPAGGGKYNDKGDLVSITATIEIQYQEINDAGATIGAWINLVTQSWTLRTLTPQRFSIDKAIKEGRYQIRVRRTDDAVLDSNGVKGTYMGKMMWEGLLSFLPGTLSYNQSTIALRIKASNAITQQAASSISIICTRKLPIYNSVTKKWSEQPQPTRKLVAALSHILRTDWGGRLPDRLIDLETLWGAIDNKMTELGWTFDGHFISETTVWELILQICQPFRVVPRIVNGAVTFVFDQANRPVRHVFTAHDIIRNSLTMTYNTFSDSTPDDIMWSYLDESVNFQNREVRCALPDSENRTPAVQSPIGVVNRDQAHKMGIFQASVNRKRRITAKFQCEAIGRLLLMGDVCALQHPFFSNLTSGPIAWWDEDTLMFDLGVEIEVPKFDIYLTLNRPDGSPWGPCKISLVSGMQIYLDAADYQNLISQGQGNPFDWVDFGQGRLPTIWTIQKGRDFDRKMIITSVVPVDAWHYEINCINDDPTIDEYKNMPTPIWEFRGQDTGSFISLTAPSGLAVTGLGESDAPILRVTWLPVVGATGYRIEQSIGTGTWGLSQDVTDNIAEVTVAPGAIGLRVAARDSEGRVGLWSRWTGRTDALYYLAPSFDGTYAGAKATLTWSPPSTATGTGAPIAWDLFVVDAGGFTVLREIELHPDERSFTYTPEMGAADGGPFRDINFTMQYRTALGNLSESASLMLSEPAPMLYGASVEVGATSLTISNAEADSATTGLIIARGSNSNFQPLEVLETKTVNLNALPFTWSGLTTGTTYYFRIAATDAFFTATQNKLDLEWSDVYPVTPGA